MQKDDGPEISEQAWRLLTEAKIQSAAVEGLFADLPGFGKPVASIDQAVEAELAEWRAKTLLKKVHDA
jgi:hypothetical protein